MIPYSPLVGFDNNSFHPDDGEPTVYDGDSRSIAFPTTEPLRTIRITSNERVLAVSAEKDRGKRPAVSV